MLPAKRAALARLDEGLTVRLIAPALALLAPCGDVIGVLA